MTYDHPNLTKHQLHFLACQALGFQLVYLKFLSEGLMARAFHAKAGTGWKNLIQISKECVRSYKLIGNREVAKHVKLHWFSKAKGGGGKSVYQVLREVPTASFSSSEFVHFSSTPRDDLGIRIEDLQLEEDHQKVQTEEGTLGYLSTLLPTDDVSIPLKLRLHYKPNVGCAKCGHDGQTHDSKCPTRSSSRTKTHCSYPMCRSPSDHLIWMCPFLQGHCSKCLLRGHSHEDCVKMATDTKYHLFCAYAYQGRNTSLRDKEPLYDFVDVLPELLDKVVIMKNYDTDEVVMYVLTDDDDPRNLADIYKKAKLTMED